MRLRWRGRRDLAERLRPYLPDRIHAEPMVDADPIRMFLYRWMIETGDPIEVVAKGFALDQELLDAIARRDRLKLKRSEAGELARRLGLPADCFRTQPGVDTTHRNLGVLGH